MKQTEKKELLQEGIFTTLFGLAFLDSIFGGGAAGFDWLDEGGTTDEKIKNMRNWLHEKGLADLDPDVYGELDDKIIAQQKLMDEFNCEAGAIGKLVPCLPHAGVDRKNDKADKATGIVFTDAWGQDDTSAKVDPRDNRPWKRCGEDNPDCETTGWWIEQEDENGKETVAFQIAGKAGCVQVVDLPTDFEEQIKLANKAMMSEEKCAELRRKNSAELKEAMKKAVATSNAAKNKVTAIAIKNIGSQHETMSASLLNVFEVAGNIHGELTEALADISAKAQGKRGSQKALEREQKVVEIYTKVVGGGLTKAAKAWAMWSDKVTQSLAKNPATKDADGKELPVGKENFNSGDFMSQASAALVWAGGGAGNRDDGGRTLQETHRVRYNRFTLYEQDDSPIKDPTELFQELYSAIMGQLQNASAGYWKLVATESEAVGAGKTVLGFDKGDSNEGNVMDPLNAVTQKLQLLSKEVAKTLRGEEQKTDPKKMQALYIDAGKAKRIASDKKGPDEQSEAAIQQAEKYVAAAARVSEDDVDAKVILAKSIYNLVVAANPEGEGKAAAMFALEKHGLEQYLKASGLSEHRAAQYTILMETLDKRVFYESFGDFS